MGDCTTCAGTGELITDWEGYLSPPPNAPADYATEPCTTCAGTGRVDGGIRRIVGPTILLHSGFYFDFENPEASKILIEDIAHALAHICRFTGHCARFYSVAEHCVHASHLVPPENAFAALMHDAAEAVLGDVSKPLKGLLPDYKKIERRVEQAIFAKFGLPDELPASVKIADRQMLGIEQRVCMMNGDEWVGNTQPADSHVEIGFWAPPVAERAFLIRYDQLRGMDQ